MKRVSGAAAFGTMLEWYDFFLYGTAAALIFPTLFFPESDPLSGVLLSFGVYAVGFAARPLGGVVCGHLGDRIGRRTMLVVTLFLMGFSTFAIGLLPTYETIGQAAPILLIAMRILQGLATGGEWGGAALLTLEHARSRPGFWGSFVAAAVFAGLILGTLAFTVLDALVTDETLLGWAWRIPFLVSILLVAVGLYIRTRVTESPAFQSLEREGTRERTPLLTVLRRHPRNVIATFLMRIGQNTTFYIVSVFSLTYATGTLGLERSLILTAVVIGAFVAMVLCPVFGHLADVWGPGRVMGASLAFQIVFAFPFFLLLDTGIGLLVILAVTIGIGAAGAASESVQPAYFSGMFGANVRYSGVSIGREGGTVIGGGLAPLIAAALVGYSGNAWLVAGWMVVTSIAGFSAVFLAQSVADPTGTPDEPTKVPTRR